MLRIIKEKRILTPAVLCADGILGLSIVEILEDRVIITPFTTETHSTTYIATPIAILRSDLPFNLPTSPAPQSPNLPVSLSLQSLHTHFLQSNLYHPLDTTTPPLIVTLER